MFGMTFGLIGLSVSMILFYHYDNIPAIARHTVPVIICQTGAAGIYILETSLLACVVIFCPVSIFDITENWFETVSKKCLMVCFQCPHYQCQRKFISTETNVIYFSHSRHRCGLSIFFGHIHFFYYLCIQICSNVFWMNINTQWNVTRSPVLLISFAGISSLNVNMRKPIDSHA